MDAKKTVSGKQIIVIAAITVVLLIIILGLSHLFRTLNADDESLLNKDIALRTLWEKSVLLVEYKNKKVVLSNKDDVFAMLRSNLWNYEPKSEEQTVDSVIKLHIDENYYIHLYSEDYAIVECGGEKRVYKTPSGITSALIQFIEDNTTISIEDAISFLSLSDGVTVEMQGLSYVAANGKQLAKTLNSAIWEILNETDGETVPMITIDNKNGLKMYFYDTLNTAAIEYNGVKTFYSVDELTIPSVALVVRSYLNEIVKTIAESVQNAKDLTVRKTDGEYMISSNNAMVTLLDFSKWERRFKEPAGLPETADVIIKDGTLFTLMLYKERNVAEYDNCFFTIPETVITAIDDYLSKGGQESPEVELRSELSTALLSKKTVNVTHNNKNYIMSVHQDLISILKISSWTEDISLDIKAAPDMTINIGGSQISLNFYESLSVAAVTKNGVTQMFKIAETIIPALVAYMQENLYTELWLISATELGAIQKNAESVEITVTAEDSSKEKYTGAVDEPISILAALNLVALETKPETLPSEKTEIVFKGENRFTMTLYPGENDSITVNVTGAFYSIGKHTDRWFETKTEKYKTVAGNLKALNYKAYDTVAARFGEALKTGDTETINTLIGNTDFSYDGIKTLMLNDMTLEKMSSPGYYKVTLNVEDPKDSPFEKGINNYILILGTSGGGTIVKTFAPMAKYEVFSKSSDAIFAVDDFTTWAEIAGLTFNSLSELQNKRSVANYLMLLLYKNGGGMPSAENSSVVMFTQEELNTAAKIYFGTEKYDAKETSLYNAETKLYSYEGRSVPVKYKRAAAISYDSASAKYKVTYEWYADPLCLYLESSVVYTLSKSETGIYVIHSAEPLTSAQDENPSEDIQSDETGNGEEIPQSDESLSDTETPQNIPENGNSGENGEETEAKTDETKFVPPSDLSPTETVFKYFEYLNEKSSEKAESLLFTSLKGTYGNYSFGSLKKITVLSCTQIPADFEWYEPWYKDPYDYACIAASFKIDCTEDKYINFIRGDNVYEFYLIKETETSDWRIINVCVSGEGLLG